MDTRKCHEVVSVSPKPLPLYEVGITVYLGKEGDLREIASRGMGDLVILVHVFNQPQVRGLLGDLS